MSPPVRVLERQTLVTPLGVRFWDEALGAAVGHGLAVRAWPLSDPRRRADAFANRAGVYVFAHLPGLRESEQGAGDDDFWRQPPVTARFRVEVVDRHGRFHPFCFDVDAPFRGLFPLAECVPPGSTPEAVPVFSAPARAVPAGLAVIRAELRAPDGTPAAWAVVEARAGGRRLGRAIADQKGRLLLIFPYPAPAKPPVGSPPASPPASPPGSPPISLAVPARQYRTPPLDLVAFHTPPPPAAPDIPELCRVLGQAPSRLWLKLSPPTPLPAVALMFGEEMTIQSEGRSELLIAP